MLCLPPARTTVNEPEVLDCGKYAGMTALEARKAILADLEAGGCLKEIEPLQARRGHLLPLPLHHRAHGVQAVVRQDGAAGQARHRERGEGRDQVRARALHQELYQLDGGRRAIGASAVSCGGATRSPPGTATIAARPWFAKEAPSVCPKCGCTHLTQDPDTLDTWFSALPCGPSPPWAGLMRTPRTYNYFYPTNTLVTGYDIIGFWVSRMIFSGLAYTGKAPFDTVLIHGIVRDSQGRKMSKSLGNGIDPLEVIDQYGADALRLMLIIGSTAGQRYALTAMKRCWLARNFANKLWNASRFVHDEPARGLPARPARRGAAGHERQVGADAS